MRRAAPPQGRAARRDAVPARALLSPPGPARGGTGTGPIGPNPARRREAATATEAVRAAYDAGQTDEFIEPVVIGDPTRGRLGGTDAAIFWNFRPA